LESIVTLSRSTKRAIMLLADIVMIPAALYTAISLKLGTFVHPLGANFWLYAAAVGASIPVFIRLGLYRAIIRYIGTKAVMAVVVGTTLSVALLLLLNLTIMQKEVPATAFAIYWTIALLYVAGSRYLVRTALQASSRTGQRVVIYGAGEAGARLAMALQGGNDFQPVAFVDDSPALRGSVINGMEVFRADELKEVVSEFDATGVLLAIPGATRKRRRDVLARLESFGLHVQTVPNLGDLLAGKARVDEIREVDVADLLGRDAVPPDHQLLDACIRGKSWSPGRVGPSARSFVDRL
jgi:FlaA1/EpsC-like NDP-sugar epimerase